MQTDQQEDGRRRGPWAMSMTWSELLFLHWPVAVESLRAAVPSPLELDTFDGRAWLGVVPFQMSKVRPRCVPSLPGLSSFPEINLRTYVHHGGHAGVYFFSLDAHQKLAVRAARTAFGLPYFDASMSCDLVDDWVDYKSVRTHKGAPAARFSARYRPTGRATRSEVGSLEHFLTERYSLFVVDRRGRARRGDILHDPWALSDAEYELFDCDMTRLAGLTLPDEAPHVRFAQPLDVRAWLPRRSPDTGAGHAGKHAVSQSGDGPPSVSR